MPVLNLLKLAARAAVLKVRKANACHITDYNAAAATYDDYYSRHLGRSAQTLIERLPLAPGMRILDLACGTGYFSRQLARRVGAAGSVTAVDLSEGMLARNREAARAEGLTNLRVVHADALRHLETQASEAYDGVVCGWGMCYMDHKRLRDEVARVLRPGGFAGIIENRACSLQDVSNLFRKVLLRHPEAIVKHVPIDLPRDERYLVKLFCKDALQPVASWNGKVSIPCASGKEVVEYMTRSGAAAGFLDALDKPRMDDVMNTLAGMADRLFEHGDGLPVRHEYCALVATKA